MGEGRRALVSWEQGGRRGCWGQGRHTVIRVRLEQASGQCSDTLPVFPPPTRGFEEWDGREEMIILIAELPFTKSFLCYMHSEWLNTLSFNP